MGEGTKNIQNRLAKESIFTALMILMKEKNFNDISITEITKKAGVSRMAYYRNYNYKEDILAECLDQIFEEYLKEVVKYEKGDKYQQALLFFSHYRKHQELVKNLIKSNLTHLILESYDKSLCYLFRNVFSMDDYYEEHEDYIIEYNSGGLYKILIAWIKKGMKESDEEMAKILSSLV